MKQATKAALISALVFPGLGHIMIGEKKRGWTILLITLFSIAILIDQALQRALDIVNKLTAGNQVPDIEAISRMAEQATQFSDNIFLNSLLMIIFVGWIYVTIDAYREGSKKDKALSRD
jgi:hypothetical protein